MRLVPAPRSFSNSAGQPVSQRRYLPISRDDLGAGPRSAARASRRGADACGAPPVEAPARPSRHPGRARPPRWRWPMPGSGCTTRSPATRSRRFSRPAQHGGHVLHVHRSPETSSPPNFTNGIFRRVSSIFERPRCECAARKSTACAFNIMPASRLPAPSRRL